MNIVLTLSYDGTAYFGFQVAKSFATVEASLQEVLEKILQKKVSLQAASRTDAGVHAEEQIVNFFLDSPRNLEQFHKSINQLLPKDIRVAKIHLAKDDFHPSLDAIGKEYHYRLTTASVQFPFDRLFAWHYSFPLDLKMMEQAAEFFIGKHDFKAFENISASKSKETTCTLHRISIIKKEGEIRFEIQGDRFLYKMVRNLVGTLVHVGVGKLSLKQAKELITSKDRTLGGMTAPAHGLLLKRVFYV